MKHMFLIIAVLSAFIVSGCSSGTKQNIEYSNVADKTNIIDLPAGEKLVSAGRYGGRYRGASTFQVLTRKRRVDEPIEEYRHVTKAANEQVVIIREH